MRRLALLSVLILAACAPAPIIWHAPSNLTAKQDKMVRYQCKHNAGVYGGASYSPYSTPSAVGTYRSGIQAAGAQLMNQSAGWNNLAMLAQARQQEREDFKQCMEAHGYTSLKD